MLAWVHQAIAAEREFLEGLFGMRAEEGRRMVGAIRIYGGSEEEEWMAELMDRAVSGLCTPLKVSVAISFRNEHSIYMESYRTVSTRQSGPRRAALRRTRSPIFCSFIC